MKAKNSLLLIFMVLAGYVVGGMLAQVTKNISFLSWLSYSQPIGLDAGKPAQIDLAFLKLAFGFQMNLNVSEVVLMIVAIVIGRKLR